MTARIPAPPSAALWGSALLLLVACGPDQTVSRLLPDIAVAPTSLDFGQVRVGQQGALALQIVNAGTGRLELGAIGVQDEGALGAAYGLSATSLEVEDGESTTLLVEFEPLELQRYDTQLVLGTNDPDHSLLMVPLLGEGIDGGPDIEVSPVSLDFGTVAAGSTATEVFTVRNVGDEPLTIDPESQQEGSGAFRPLTDPRGEVIAPGASFSVLMSYAPVDEGGDQGSLHLRSDDADDPEVSVAFLGNGGGKDSYPVAVIDAYRQARPGDTLILDGTGSYDPQSLIPLSYTWSLLEAPEASSAAISNPSLSAPYMTLDTSGTYTVSLQVHNSAGVASSVAVHSIEAAPEDDLFVELTWDTDDADLDLHLLRGDGAKGGGDAFFDGEADCCWCNENPDWGMAGEGQDDPLLFADAESDGGPETVLVEQPAEGEYFVRVHYFQDNGAATTEATVRVFVAGELAQTWSRDLTHNEVWEVGYVRWPQGYVVDEDEAPYDSTLRTCR